MVKAKNARYIREELIPISSSSWEKGKLQQKLQSIYISEILALSFSCTVIRKFDSCGSIQNTGYLTNVFDFQVCVGHGVFLELIKGIRNILLMFSVVEVK